MENEELTKRINEALDIVKDIEVSFSKLQTALTSLHDDVSEKEKDEKDEDEDEDNEEEDDEEDEEEDEEKK